MGLILDARSTSIFGSVAYGKAAVHSADVLSKGPDFINRRVRALCSCDEISINRVKHLGDMTSKASMFAIDENDCKVLMDHK